MKWHPSLIPALRRAAATGDQLCGAAADALEACSSGGASDNLDALAIRLRAAWDKYQQWFGEGPNGSLRQIRSMLEFLPVGVSDDTGQVGGPVAVRRTATADAATSDRSAASNSCPSAEPSEEQIDRLVAAGRILERYEDPRMRPLSQENFRFYDSARKEIAAAKRRAPEPVAKPNPCRNECSLISLDDDHWKCNHCDAVFAYTGAQKPVEKPRCWWPLCKETAGDALCDAVQSALTKGAEHAD